MKQPGAIDTLFRVYMFAWAGLGIGGWFYIWRAPTAELKRHAHSRVVIIAAVTFLASVCAAVLLGLPSEVLALAVPAVLLIAWLNLRFTTFCDACNRMIYNALWWHRVRSCPHCGAGLTKTL